jgi:uncharacterized protein
VRADGPFSDFSGYDRVLVLLKGKGFVLRDEDNQELISLDKELKMYRFPGELKINCTLIDGHCEDWNWFTLRS